ncbi:MAG: sulfotransferase [Pseudomonadota bacterium]
MAQASLKRPPVVRAINVIGKAMSGANLALPRFTPEGIRKAAERQTGYSDYGSDSYLAGLTVLCSALETESELNQMGRFVLHRQLVAALAGRLTVVAWEKANPKLANAPIAQPTFVIGLPRTGTTILYETLAADPAVRAPLTWECRDFALAHEIDPDDKDDPRLKRLARQMEQVDRLMPGFTAIHKFGPHIPTECIGLFLLDMSSEQFGAMAWMPSYREFMLNSDYETTYQWHKRGLRYLQATQPDKAWMLKSPLHSGYLPALLKTYPDATIVQTHRKPIQVIASVANLYRVSRGGWSDAVVDVKARALADAAYYAELIRRATAFRTSPEGQTQRIYDVAFEKFLGDPMAVIEDLHTFFEKPLTETAHAAMVDYLENRPRDKYGKHVYSAEDFGFSEDTTQALFSDYLETFRTYL